MNEDQYHYPEGHGCRLDRRLVDEPVFTRVPAWKVGYKDADGIVGQTTVTEESMDPVVVAFLNRQHDPGPSAIRRVYVTYEDGCHVLFEKS
jgi:hypothetical protein